VGGEKAYALSGISPSSKGNCKNQADAWTSGHNNAHRVTQLKGNRKNDRSIRPKTQGKKKKAPKAVNRGDTLGGGEKLSGGSTSLFEEGDGRSG